MFSLIVSPFKQALEPTWQDAAIVVQPTTQTQCPSMKQTQTILTLSGLFMVLVNTLLSKPTTENISLFARIAGTMPLTKMECSPWLITLKIYLLSGYSQLGISSEVIDWSFATSKQVVS